ncbi:undecaprenyl-diphosphatase UppP [Candidatus Uhrbacteria bacterium RIFOXYB12_FULL_58_10]|uniref:Undecaprenyl-diphosphatase n=1 Tax=Candidatus Uhrbacteria bacterium RIFOXYB2_FULL_57_15 TaxID=1802422 RepID=A0A1F7W6S9_9BACT|nr:MAG: undecaprenyl-diphosphatase UppP [Candidatus Uhrbacteria bacterium RIFOXYB12_FULL_58_10]OGL98480.1 MAG: undecaprenyl-diphosphatase UppP [Candidatus Uhrbacteria bacterium RIFOXYB2_FULL_57_15]OGL99205.1 MAG: undecaprenyl-diphosphatase UppP [Candidatus Uhrbacteria bacterium RIFOXYC12_FULL_57_11]
MSVVQALVLGIVQGITEFLPISSSGHLILAPILFGWQEQPLAFDAVIHLGTLAAILAALRGDLPKLLERRGRLGWTILAATIPALAIGFLFKDQIETVLRSPMVVAASLALWGMLLWAGDRMVKPGASDDVTKVGYQRAMFIGVAQAIALIPGTSRSGVTITAGLFTGLSREAAARFSFLLGIPAIAAAGASALLDVIDGAEPVAMLPLAVGFLAAFVFGILAIRLLLKILKTSTFVPFAVYRMLLAVVVFVLLR